MKFYIGDKGLLVKTKEEAWFWLYREEAERMIEVMDPNTTSKAYSVISYEHVYLIQVEKDMKK